MKAFAQVIRSAVAAISIHAATNFILAGPADRGGGRQAPTDDAIGLEVHGPSQTSMGEVRDLVIDERTGEVAMYVVESDDWFGGYGVIPMKFASVSEPEADGRRRVISTINEMTFENVARWDGKGQIGRYLSKYRQLLATVYGLDAAELMRASDWYSLITDRGADGYVAARRQQ